MRLQILLAEVERDSKKKWREHHIPCANKEYKYTGIYYKVKMLQCLC